MHKKPLTKLEEQGLRGHGLDIGKPSQLSDCFRHGVAWALKDSQSRTKELISAIRSINKSDKTHLVHIGEDKDPCYWQRKEWIEWVLELADETEQELTQQDL